MKINAFVFRGADGQRELAESKPWVDRAQYEEQIIAFVVSGAEGQREIADSKPRVELSMWRKLMEIRKDDQIFHGSVGLRESANSQNLSLGLPQYGEENQ